MIDAVLFNSLVQKTSQTKNIWIFSFLIRNIEKILAPKSITDLVKKLPTKYYKFFNIFFLVNSDILPPHYSYNHKIPLIEGETPPWGPLYSMS